MMGFPNVLSKLPISPPPISVVMVNAKSNVLKFPVIVLHVLIVAATWLIGLGFPISVQVNYWLSFNFTNMSHQVNLYLVYLKFKCSFENSMRKRIWYVLCVKIIHFEARLLHLVRYQLHQWLCLFQHHLSIPISKHILTKFKPQ